MINKSKREKGKSNPIFWAGAVLLLAVCAIALSLYGMSGSGEKGKEERYRQYLQQELANAVCSMEYVEHAAVAISDGGQGCQVEISVEMQEGQDLSGEDEDAIRKITESVLSGHYSGEIVVTFMFAGR